MIKAVLFDFDGLMFDTESAFERAFWVANKKFDMPLTEKDRQECTGKNDKIVREELKERFPSKDVDGYRDEFFRVAYEIMDTKGVKMKKGLRQLLWYLKQNNYKVAIVTSSEKEKIVGIMNRHGLSQEIFDTIVSRSDNLPGKPNPDVFLAAAKKLEVSPKECLVLEDSINGIIASSRAGIQSIMIPDRVPPNEKTKECGAIVLKNLKQVIKFLKQKEK